MNWGEKTRAELVEIVGEIATVRLCAAFGGLRVPIPYSPTPVSHIAKAIGIEGARKLSARWGGCEVYIPQPPERRRRIAGRRQAIARADGSTAEVAREFGVSQRWVEMVRSGRRRPA